MTRRTQISVYPRPSAVNYAFAVRLRVSAVIVVESPLRRTRMLFCTCETPDTDSARSSARRLSRRALTVPESVTILISTWHKCSPLRRVHSRRARRARFALLELMWGLCLKFSNRCRGCLYDAAQISSLCALCLGVCYNHRDAEAQRKHVR
jgi:hypothetical protein